MGNLLRASTRRLWRDKLFWLAVLFLAISSVWFGYLTYETTLRVEDTKYYVEDVLFNLLPMIGFVCAFFISWYLGADYDDNTIRNKLVVGHTRREVYAAQFCTCLLASWAQLTVLLGVSGITGVVLLHKFLLSPKELAWLILNCYLLTAVFSAMFTAFGMNIQSKAGALVVTLVFLFGIMMLCSYCGNSLNQQAQNYSYVVMSAEGVEFGPLVDNPNYVSGTRRVVYQLIYDLFPTGQCIQMNNLEYENVMLWPIYSAVLLAVSALLGWFGFRKRDIK